MIWNTIPVGNIRIKKCFAFFPTDLTEENKTVWLRFYFEEQELRYLPHIKKHWHTRASWLTNNPENKKAPSAKAENEGSEQG